MRLLVFFDLPVLTVKQRRDYSKFRTALIKDGFIMLQESIYSKLLLNPTAVEFEKQFIRNNKPDEGLIQILTVTEKQFSRIEYILGDEKSEVLNSSDRLVVI